MVIEQAKGKLAAALDSDPDGAFEAMRAYARGRNRRLREVAEDLVAGALDARDLR